MTNGFSAGSYFVKCLDCNKSFTGDKFATRCGVCAEKLAIARAERQKLIDRIAFLEHQYDSSRGLWCIDRDPKDVDHEWIKRNAFQLL